MKFKLDCSSSVIIQALDSLNYHLNIYQKPHDNLKTIIDSFVKILIDAISYDIHQLHYLPDFFSYFDHVYKFLEKQTLEISKIIDNVPTTQIRIHFYIIYQLHTNTKSSLYSVLRSFDNFKNKNINKIIEDIRFNINSLSVLKQKLIEIKSSLSSISTIHDYISKKDEINKTLDQKLNNLNIVESIEFLIKYMKSIDNLSLVSNGVSTLKSDITKEKNKLFQLMQRVKRLKSLLPTKIEKGKKVKESYEGLKHNFPNFDRLIEPINNEIKSDEKLLKYSNELFSFLARSNDKVEYIIGSIDILKESIDDSISKLKGIKSKLNKRKLIEYIINLIDQIKFIIRVEPSNIVEHLKPIYSIKPELESIINSIKTTDIQNDILNLEKLYSEMVDIESFSRNMKRIKEYIGSVENHLAGLESILKSLNNIRNLIDSKYIKLIVYDLDSFYDEQYSKDKSKLNEIIPLKKYIDEMKKYIKELKTRTDVLLLYISRLMCIIIELKKTVERINSEIKCLKSDITNMECAIDGVVINFIQCTLLSTSNSIVRVISPSSHNIDSIYNNIKYIMLKCVCL